MRKITILCSLFLTNLSLHSQVVDKCDYKVYDAIIRYAVSDSVSSITIANKTTREDFTDYWHHDTSDWHLEQFIWETRFHSEFDIVAYQMIANFYRNKHVSKRLTEKFDVPIDCRLIKWKRFLKYFDSSDGGDYIDEGWKKYYDEFPDSGGIMVFSNVFYSPNCELALVYVSHRRGGLDGWGALLLLENKDGIWFVLKYLEIWVN